MRCILAFFACTLLQALLLSNSTTDVAAQTAAPFTPQTFAVLGYGETLLFPPACPSGYQMQIPTLLLSPQTTQATAVASSDWAMPTSDGPTSTTGAGYYILGFRDPSQNALPAYKRVTCKTSGGCGITADVSFYCQPAGNVLPVKADKTCSTGLSISSSGGATYACIDPSNPSLSWNFDASASPGATLPWSAWAAPPTGSTPCAYSTSCTSGTCTIPAGFTNLYISCSNGATPVTSNAPVCYCPAPTPVVNGAWSAWGVCSSSCTQKRTCTNPAPSGGGAACTGPSTQTCSGGACTAASGGTTGYDPTVWLGTYAISGGCDQTQCCCAQTSTVTAGSSGTTYIIMGTNLAGQCGSSPPVSVTATTPTPTSNTASYVAGGQMHIVTRQGNGDLIDQNQGTAACSATLTKSYTPAPSPRVSAAAMVTSSPLNLAVVMGSCILTAARLLL